MLISGLFDPETKGNHSPVGYSLKEHRFLLFLIISFSPSYFIPVTLVLTSDLGLIIRATALGWKHTSRVSEDCITASLHVWNGL